MMTLRRFNRPGIPLLALWLAVCGQALEAGIKDRVEVVGVQFANVSEPAGTGAAWLEMSVELEARPAPERPGRVTDPLRVRVYLAHETPATAALPRRWVFFRSGAELAGLAAGRSRVRFYLPPEVLQRERLTGAPRFWEVALSGGSLVPSDSDRNRATELAEANVNRSFHDKIITEAPANDGILLPQYLTPFAHDPRRPAPAGIRREGWQ